MAYLVDIVYLIGMTNPIMLQSFYPHEEAIVHCLCPNIFFCD